MTHKRLQSYGTQTLGRKDKIFFDKACNDNRQYEHPDFRHVAKILHKKFICYFNKISTHC